MHLYLGGISDKSSLLQKGLRSSLPYPMEREREKETLYKKSRRTRTDIRSVVSKYFTE